MTRPPRAAPAAKGKAVKVGNLPLPSRFAPRWIPTTYGVIWGDLELVRIASSRDGERRRWVALDVVAQNGTRITIHATPKTCRYTVTPARRAGKGGRRAK